MSLAPVRSLEEHSNHRKGRTDPWSAGVRLDASTPQQAQQRMEQALVASNRSRAVRALAVTSPRGCASPTESSAGGALAAEEEQFLVAPAVIALHGCSLPCPLPPAVSHGAVAAARAPLL